MKLSFLVRSPSFENKVFLVLLSGISLALLWVLWPFYGSVFWGSVFAFMFTPLYRRLLNALRTKDTWAALLTLLVILLLVILPIALISALLMQEANAVYARIQSGELRITVYFQQIYDALPVWVTELLNRSGLSNLSLVQEKLSSSLAKGSQFLATQVLSIGQNTFDFLVGFSVMLYLMFFLLRDGAALCRRIGQAVPLNSEIKHNLASKFATVIWATVKGNIVIAVLQGALGGMAFWTLGIHAPILWGTVMAFLSLLPAVGAALVWLPVAIYFLVTGAVLKGVMLIVFGVMVVGLVDNVLRPVLVGKDTRMPDYVVLISTLGGMAIFGLNGFVIGPVVAAMFMAAWDIFSKARQEADVQKPVAKIPPPV
ncbi:MAG: AI-2E family transporter [Polaromonas sp.]